MKNLKGQATILAIIFIAVVSVATGYLYLKNRELKSSDTNSVPLTWEECLKQPKATVQESYPGVCRLPDGRTSIQPLSEEEKENLQPPGQIREPVGSVATANWKTHTDSRLGFSIKYPTDWKMTPAPKEGVGGMVSLSGVFPSGGRALIEIGKQIDSLRSKESLMDFEKRKYGGNLLESKETKYKIFDDLNTFFQMIKIDGGDTPYTYGLYYIFSRGKDVYFLEGYSLRPEKDQYFVEQILATFKFLDEESSSGGYACPDTEYVNCMPMVAPGEPEKKCEKTYLDWAAKNCPAFKGPVY